MSIHNKDQLPVEHIFRKPLPKEDFKRIAYKEQTEQLFTILVIE